MGKNNLLHFVTRTDPEISNNVCKFFLPLQKKKDKSLKDTGLGRRLLK